MVRTALVPDPYVVLLPSPTTLKIRVGESRTEELVEQRTLVGMHASDSSHVGAAQKQRAATRLGMHANQRMPRTLMLLGDPHTPMKFICDADNDQSEAIDCGGDD